MLNHPFLTLDDNLYVTACPQVQTGLSWAGTEWAFTNTVASNWHPLTWLGHMLDYQLYGLKAGGHHLTNLLFHIGNTLLLFLWLRGLTGTLWRSALVAALFAWHPLHVESVAWIAELKDVLSTFFWLLSLLAYTRYVRKPGTINYLTMLFLFTCALLSKPMVVTLPFVLLLVDFWPMNRLTPANFSFKAAGRLVLEKFPFFVLSAVASVVNYTAQNGGGATWSSDAMPLHVRLANILISYLRYISKTFCPTDLAVIYPFQSHWPLPAILGAGLFLLVCCVLAVLSIRQKPFLFFGWFYFVGTLVPAIGLVQIGPQAMADRYSYIPSIGLFIIIVWSANELLVNRMKQTKLAVAAVTIILCACCLCTARQLRFWDSSVNLFAHAVAVTSDNYIATDYLGGALDTAGRKEEALICYAASVRINPHFAMSQWNLGLSLLNQGYAADATEHLAAACQLATNDPVIHCYYGKALLLTGHPGEAETQFAKALQLKPDLADAHFYLGVDLATQKNIAGAVSQFAEAVRLNPSDPEMRFNYGLALLENHQPAEAVAQFNEELRLAPDTAKAHYRLAQALQRQGKFAEAVAHFQRTLQLTPDFSDAKKELDVLLAAHPELK